MSGDLEKIRSLERKLDRMRISALENEVKRLEVKIEVLEKIKCDFEIGDCVLQVRDDKLERELKVTKVTVKCVWDKGHDDEKAFLKRKSNIIKFKETAK